MEESGLSNAARPQDHLDFAIPAVEILHWIGVGQESSRYLIRGSPTPCCRGGKENGRMSHLPTDHYPQGIKCWSRAIDFAYASPFLQRTRRENRKKGCPVILQHIKTAIPVICSNANFRDRRNSRKCCTLPRDADKWIGSLSC